MSGEYTNSPLPWVARGRGAIDDAQGVRVTTIDGEVPFVQRRRDLIVRAVNAHEDLVASLGGLIAYCDATLPKPAQASVALANARAALARARGETP